MTDATTPRSHSASGKAFPIPVHVQFTGAGSQPTEGDSLAYMPMPRDMETYRPPLLPEPEELVGHESVKAVFHAVLAALTHLQGSAAASCDQPTPPAVISLGSLSDADRRLLDTILGEGEVSAIIHESAEALARPPLAQLAQQGNDPRDVHGGGVGLRQLPDAHRLPPVTVQESVFAGVWRVLESDGQRIVRDTLEVGAIPSVIAQAAARDVRALPQWVGELPPGVLNAPSILAEIAERTARWQMGQEPEVINLTLLPMTQEDIAFVDHHLGTGRLVILSRGYGNCRITSTCTANTWRLVYYNSQDTVILSTIDIGSVPAVALAAPEDLAASEERLHEVLQWLEQA